MTTDQQTATLASHLRQIALTQLSQVSAGIAALAYARAHASELSQEALSAAERAQKDLETAYTACGWLLQKVQPWEYVAQPQGQSAALTGPVLPELPEVEVPEPEEATG